MFWVYILRCADGSYYTGHTDNFERRIGQYQVEECEGYTVTRRPVALIWSQECVTREEALSAEVQIKGWSCKKKEALLRGPGSQALTDPESRSKFMSLCITESSGKARGGFSIRITGKPRLRYNAAQFISLIIVCPPSGFYPTCLLTKSPPVRSSNARPPRSKS